MIIKVDVRTNCSTQGFVILKMIRMVHFRLHNSPEALHGCIVKATTDAGHTVACAGFFYYSTKYTAGILHSTIAVDHRFCVWVFFKCLMESCQNKRCIVPSADGKRHDISAVQIQHRAQVRFAARAVFELGYVSHPLLILSLR